MFNFWFSEFVIPIVVTCPPSPQTTDIDDMKLGQHFEREMNRENCNRSKNLSIVCLRFPVVFTQMFVSSLPSASPDPSIGCTDLSGNTKRKNTGINFGPEIVGNNGAKRNTSVFSLLFIIAFWLSRVWKALHWLHVISVISHWSSIGSTLKFVGTTRVNSLPSENRERM